MSDWKPGPGEFLAVLAFGVLVELAAIGALGLSVYLFVRGEVWIAWALLAASASLGLWVIWRFKRL